MPNDDDLDYLIDNILEEFHRDEAYDRSAERPYNNSLDDPDEDYDNIHISDAGPQKYYYDSNEVNEYDDDEDEEDDGNYYEEDWVEEKPPVKTVTIKNTNRNTVKKKSKSKKSKKDKNPPKPKKKSDKVIQVILSLIIVICLVGLGIIVPKIYHIIMDYKEAREVYAEISDSAVMEVPDDEAPTEEEIRRYLSMTLEDASPEYIDQLVTDYITTWVPIEVDWDYLRSVNSNIVGWIYSPNTIINYPVVQTTNNDYYLNHSFKGEYSGGGAIFANYQSTIGNTLSNLIIYGHHMKDNSMFGSLKYYKDASYYQEHPTMYFLTPTQNYRVDIICGHIVESGSSNFPILFRGADSYQEYLNKIVGSCSWSNATAATTSKQLITLVTCDYTSGYSDPRYIVQGSMTPIGTSSDIKMYLYQAQTEGVERTISVTPTPAPSGTTTSDGAVG